jgi:hypothetical protein
MEKKEKQKTHAGRSSEHTTLHTLPFSQSQHTQTKETKDQDKYAAWLANNIIEYEVELQQEQEQHREIGESRRKRRNTEQLSKEHMEREDEYQMEMDNREGEAEQYKWKREIEAAAEEEERIRVNRSQGRDEWWETWVDTQFLDWDTEKWGSEVIEDLDQYAESLAENIIEYEEELKQ